MMADSRLTLIAIAIALCLSPILLYAISRHISPPVLTASVEEGCK